MPASNVAVRERWRKSVLDIVERLQAALVCDSVLLGGGNAKLMEDLPSHVILGANSNAIDGGIKLWQDWSVHNGNQCPATRPQRLPMKAGRQPSPRVTSSIIWYLYHAVPA